VATMQAVMLTRKGGPDVLETVELPLPEPGPGEVRVRVRATGVGATDITMRRGSYPYARGFLSCPATSRSASSTLLALASRR
jgi:NADPH2:quinone reductase